MLVKKYQKRLLFGSSFLAFISLLIARFFMVPYFSGKPTASASGIISSILDNLLAALVTSISIACLVLWLNPPEEQSAIMEIVDSPHISGVLKKGRDRVSEYWYKGNTGRYFRSVTLPDLANEARLDNTTKNIFLIILDPTNEKTCNYYSSFRGKLRSAAKDKPWTGLRVRLELYSAIISAYAWKAQEPALNITVALVDTVSLFRIDFSSRLVVITREDERQPALMCRSDSLFYKSYREDLFVSFQQAKILSNNILGVPFTLLDVESTRKILDDVGLGCRELSDSDIFEIISLSRRAENPYA
ncbi:hypothetical protein [Nodosilinea sp. E11]|uniref:hypothetical protein n=1 Tax=Nodosilinea sp. E11 TaxID=3037479 RepID=UPI0029349FBE|nr:hypothetical protein [Nodosilinea sp. E11]WOD37773.1 hypothetical protein RRF56_16300 [Nodosilinea sp. E11]